MGSGNGLLPVGTKPLSEPHSSTWAQVMASCLSVPNHYLNHTVQHGLRYWLVACRYQTIIWTTRFNMGSGNGFLPVGMISFLHDQPWISPWIKSIFNELDITITWSHHNCLVIVTSPAERKPSEWDTGTMSKARRLFSHLWIRNVM